jgi:serine/alanine racemase
MAVVKADAYGHGATQVAKRLEDEGVQSFAVATVSEGILLRQNGIVGDILILSYTDPANAAYLHNYNLKQLIIDGEYAKALNNTGYKISVHISIDTGMHREGIDSHKTDEIESVFKQENLNVEGIATHFSSSDSLAPEDIEFTNTQIERFSNVISYLITNEYSIGKLHSQATYGLLNYSHLQYNYMRAGIALYGVMSHIEETKTKLDLKPVLSLKARIAQVRWIEAGESVSYGRSYISEKRLKLATVCIGYADGVPRSMSGNGGVCLVHGYKVPIIGRVCMDLLMIDVTAVESVTAGDIVTLIGTDGSELIRCEDVASVSDTITNEVLCRLGSRLPRIYI